MGQIQLATLLAATPRARACGRSRTHTQRPDAHRRPLPHAHRRPLPLCGRSRTGAYILCASAAPAALRPRHAACRTGRPAARNPRRSGAHLCGHAAAAGNAPANAPVLHSEPKLGSVAIKHACRHNVARGTFSILKDTSSILNIDFNI